MISSLQRFFRRSFPSPQASALFFDLRTFRFLRFSIRPFFLVSFGPFFSLLGLSFFMPGRRPFRFPLVGLVCPPRFAPPNGAFFHLFIFFLVRRLSGPPPDLSSLQSSSLPGLRPVPPPRFYLLLTCPPPSVFRGSGFEPVDVLWVRDGVFRLLVFLPLRPFFCFRIGVVYFLRAAADLGGSTRRFFFSELFSFLVLLVLSVSMRFPTSLFLGS